MLKTTLLFISILLGGLTYSQYKQNVLYSNHFEDAYSTYPAIPSGILEAVSYAQTRMTDLHHSQESCIGLPEVEGVMGLVVNGQGYFNNNQFTVAQLSNTEIGSMGVPATDILAYASAYNVLMQQNNVTTFDYSGHDLILKALSEIPSDGNLVNNYALNCFTYEVFQFLRDEQNQAIYGFSPHNIVLKDIYGPENYKVLSSKRVEITTTEIKNLENSSYTPQTKSLEYGPAIWVATPSCNFSSRSGTAISAVTVHTIQGTYAGAISWAQNCNSNVSYHYVARSTDGQITQMVYEADKGWHVGSENPYTIGIEHEGYVDNPAWYTEAMYIGSANLVKDITQSGYGINPLRTFQGPATTGGNVLGGCTKIKGHQHFQNQSHTDPGINWNWEHYYQLINDSPVISTLSSSTGVFYDSGGAGADYSDDERELYLIEPVNVLNVTISFQQFALEDNWDYMYVYDGSTTTDPVLGVYTGSTLPADITSSGPTMLVEFRSDCATQDAGWEISWTSVPGPVPGDVIPPTTDVDVNNIWQTTDFNSVFTDADNLGGSGVHYSFYQVIDYDGTEWRANNNNGFFSDNFDVAIHADWTSETGTWAINSGTLNQSDEGLVNTNIHAALNQDNDDQWLFHFGGKISGAGANKRGGFHFMCDDATLPNRGNSYFVWFRADNDKVQIYKTVNDIFSLEADIPFTINQDQWYDYKTVYDKNTGSIEVWVDDELAASWVDTSPYVSGNAISVRSGDSNFSVENLKVYHNRGASELVTVGATNDIRFQNPDPLTSSGKIKSIVIDSSSNISSIGQELVDVDWTSPNSIALLNDGIAADINTTATNTELSANWSPSEDVNSDIARYWYAIGTTSGGIDIVPWTDNWFDTTVTHSGLNLVEGTTYFFSVFAENGAGLFSDTVSTDGQTVVAPTAIPTAGFIIPNSYICSYQSVQVFNSSINAQTYSWSAPGATPATSTDVNPTFTFPNTGNYDITLTATGIGGTDIETQTIFVNIETIPSAGFVASETTVDISNAFVTFSNSSINANGYLWNFGDGNISTDTDPWHQFTAVGMYPVMLVAINGNCPNDTVQMMINVIDDLSLGNLDGFSFSVFPNPVNDQINILLDNSWANDVQIQLMDEAGKTVYYELIQLEKNIQIVFQEKQLSNGLYILKVSDKNKVENRKLIVRHK
jgi:PKD repeat protein/N-acetyl-anhydromuramyl-L-alanine amidase AmpD